VTRVSHDGRCRVRVYVITMVKKKGEKSRKKATYVTRFLHSIALLSLFSGIPPQPMLHPLHNPRTPILSPILLFSITANADGEEENPNLATAAVVIESSMPLSGELKSTLPPLG
jgi:hypothetical protein